MSADDTPPRLWWSASLHSRCGWGLIYSIHSGKFVVPAALPADAVELRPAVPTTTASATARVGDQVKLVMLGQPDGTVTSLSSYRSRLGADVEWRYPSGVTHLSWHPLEALHVESAPAVPETVGPPNPASVATGSGTFRMGDRIEWNSGDGWRGWEPGTIRAVSDGGITVLIDGGDIAHRVQAPDLRHAGGTS